MSEDRAARLKAIKRTCSSFGCGGRDEWPDTPSRQHEEGCPIAFLLDEVARLEKENARCDGNGGGCRCE